MGKPDRVHAYMWWQLALAGSNETQNVNRTATDGLKRLLPAMSAEELAQAKQALAQRKSKSTLAAAGSN